MNSENDSQGSGRHEFPGKKIIASIIVFFLIGGAFFLGYRTGSINHSQIEQVDLLNKESGMPSQVDFSPFWQTWNIINQKFVQTHSTSTVTDQDKVYGAIKGMVASLGDPYTVFFPPSDNSMFQSEISGNFEGIGMEVGVTNNVLTVISALKGTPADKAGIMPGDEILKINDEDAADMSVDQAVTLIRGPKGTNVSLTILRKNSKTPQVLSITRNTIDIPTIETTKRPDGVFVISLYNFTADSPNLFRDALRQFVLSGSDKLILDLRGNPGGYLDAAVDIASWFLPQGKTIVQEDYGNGKPKDISVSKGYDIFSNDLKFAILINGGSASASEILAGALQEYGKAKLVGTQSFGKGSVQELIPITADTSLKVTIARWLTPMGKSISNGGLTPDYVVPFTEQDAASGTDPQMQKAADLLNGK